MRSTALLLLACLCTACAYDAPNTPTPVTPAPSTAPASIRLTASSRVDGNYDVTAEVLTSGLNVVPGVAVTFGMSAGSINPVVAMTDSTGYARGIATATGTSTLSASVAGVSQTSTTTITPFAPNPPTTPQPPTFPTPPSTPTPAAPSFTLLAPASVTAGTVTSLGISGTTGSGINAWTWTFGDGSAAITSAPFTSHTYSTAGSVTASVSGTDTLGRSASSQTTIVIQAGTGSGSGGGGASNTFAIALNCVPGTGTPPSLTACNVQATLGANPVPSTDYSVSWDWGDGTPPTTTVLGSHAYAQAGTYTVIATVTGSGSVAGMSASANAKLVVQ